MLRNEFEDRIGRKVENEEWYRANLAYQLSDVDKDQFCKEWETIKGSRVLTDVARVADCFRTSWTKEQKMRADAEKKAEELQNEYNQLQESYDDLCDHAQDLADEATAKQNEVSALEEKVRQLEAEKATLYKILEKFLDK